MVNYLRNLNLRTKLILIYFFATFIPVILVGQIILRISTDQIITQTTKEVCDASAQTSSNVADLLDQYLTIVDRISLDPTLAGYLDTSRYYNGVDDCLDAYRLYLRPVSNYDFSFAHINSLLKIFFLNDTLLQDYGTYIYADEQIRGSDMFMAAINAEDRPAWGLTKNGIFAARVMYGRDNAPSAVVSIEIAESRLYTLIEESGNDNKYVMIWDDKGNVVSSTERELLGQSVKDRVYFDEVMAGESGILEYNDSGRYKVVYESIGGGRHLPNWKIATIIPIDNVLAVANRIRDIGLLVCALCLFLSCVVFWQFLHRMTNRMRALVRSMQGVQEGNLTVMKDTFRSSDEIGIMVDNYNLMIESLQRLIYENYEVNLTIKDTELKKREAELYALQSQINPHFLFNTLESIRMKLHNENNEDATEMILSLSKILRTSLNWSGDIVTLREEMDFARNYLSIQSLRFKDKMNYTIEVPEELLDIRIPKLIIQPIVENAIRHGLEKKKGIGKVSVNAFICEHTLVIIIQDDGKGIEEQKLMQIKTNLQSDINMKTSGSIGLKNVYDRISLLCGEKYGINIESTIDKGTSVYIEIPVDIA